MKGKGQVNAYLLDRTSTTVDDEFTANASSSHVISSPANSERVPSLGRSDSDEIVTKPSFLSERSERSASTQEKTDMIAKVVRSFSRVETTKERVLVRQASMNLRMTMLSTKLSKLCTCSS